MSLEDFNEVLQELIVLNVKLEMISDEYEDITIDGLNRELHIILGQEAVSDTIEKGIDFHRTFSKDIERYFKEYCKNIKDR